MKEARPPSCWSSLSQIVWAKFGPSSSQARTKLARFGRCRAKVESREFDQTWGEFDRDLDEKLRTPPLFPVMRGGGHCARRCRNASRPRHRRGTSRRARRGAGEARPWRSGRPAPRGRAGPAPGRGGAACQPGQACRDVARKQKWIPARIARFILVATVSHNTVLRGMGRIQHRQLRLGGSYPSHCVLSPNLYEMARKPFDGPTMRVRAIGIRFLGQGGQDNAIQIQMLERSAMMVLWRTSGHWEPVASSAMHRLDNVPTSSANGESTQG